MRYLMEFDSAEEIAEAATLLKGGHSASEAPVSVEIDNQLEMPILIVAQPDAGQADGIILSLFQRTEEDMLKDNNAEPVRLPHGVQIKVV